MKSFRVLAMGAMALLSVGWLQAVPVVRLTLGGGHTTDITSADCTMLGPGTCIVLFNPVDLNALDANGLGSLGIQNDLAQTITGLDFFLPTVNFNQNFQASTDLFTNASLAFTPAVGPVDGYTSVDFFGTGNGTGGTVGPKNPCSGLGLFIFNCPVNGPVGFDAESLKPDAQFPNGEGFLIVTFGTANSGTLGGLTPCSVNASACEATLAATAVPEPRLLLLLLVLLSSPGVLVMARRKLYRR
ncbi:MAG: hypothetical protein LAP39_26790 [Acidobacteriia bacterium]|nr:hypothetical protein [Terriglobia bacterium]